MNDEETRKLAMTIVSGAVIIFVLVTLVVGAIVKHWCA